MRFPEDTEAAFLRDAAPGASVKRVWVGQEPIRESWQPYVVEQQESGEWWLLGPMRTKLATFIEAYEEYANEIRDRLTVGAWARMRCPVCGIPAVEIEARLAKPVMYTHHDGVVHEDLVGMIKKGQP